MRFNKNIGFLLLAIWLILTGLSAFIPLGGLGVILALLAIAAGVFILIGRQIDVIRSARQRIPLLVLIILTLTMYWLLIFFGQSLVPGIPHTSRFVDILSIVIVVLIIAEFLL